MALPRLYHYGGSLCSMKVRLCLAEKGVAYEGIYVDLLRFENLHADYLALNPNGVVPTLVHDGVPIIESTIINEFIDEVFDGPQLVPEAAAAKARMRVWTKLQDDVVHPAIQKPTFNLLIKPYLQRMDDAELEVFTARHPHEVNRQLFRNAAKGGVDEAAIAAATEQLAFVFGRMEQALSQDPWLAGSTYSLADIALAPAIDRLAECGMFDLFAPYPNVLDWTTRVKTRPAFQHMIPAQDQRYDNMR